MLNVVCVLKKPDDARLSYDPSWVQKLRRGVARNLSEPHRFVCLTDFSDIADVETIPLKHGWMTYWSKVEMFRPGLFDGPTLYFDVDSMVCSKLDELIKTFDGMTMLTDYYQTFCNSGFMRWDASNPIFNEIYNKMLKNPMSTMLKHRYRAGSTKNFNYGDQEYIATTLTELDVKIFEWQKLYPKHWFMPFSFEGRLNPAVMSAPDDMKVCYSLGAPKFSDYPQIELVRTNWY